MSLGVLGLIVVDELNYHTQYDGSGERFHLPPLLLTIMPSSIPGTWEWIRSSSGTSVSILANSFENGHTMHDIF